MKFVFFVKNGDALLDGTLEEPLDKVALTGKFESNSLAQYTIKSTAQLTTAKNLRKSFKLFVVGPVPQATVSTFDNTLMEDWTAAKSISGRRLVHPFTAHKLLLNVLFVVCFQHLILIIAFL